MAKKANTAQPEEKAPVDTPEENTTDTPRERFPDETQESADEVSVECQEAPDRSEPGELAPELSDIEISSLPGCPLVGDSVHYIAKGNGERRAAIVTKVNEPGNPTSAVSLRVFAPERDYIKHDVPFATKPEGWQWKRVEALPNQ